MSNDDKHIREFAYQIWESEGRPEGQEARHWDMAHKLAQAQALLAHTRKFLQTQFPDLLATSKKN